MFSVFLPIKGSISIIKNHDEAIARWVSHVVSPHIVGIILTSALSFHSSQDALEILQWLMVLIPLIVVPPLSYVLWLVYRGALEDMYMPKRESRLRPLAVFMVWIFVCLGLTRHWEAPPIVETFILATIILVSVLGLVTLFWKISFHGATISAAATATVVVAGYSTWPIMLLVPLVGWSRIRLERHTPRQVIYGSLIGALIALVIAQGILLRAR